MAAFSKPSHLSTGTHIKRVMVRVCPLVTAEIEVLRTAGGDSYWMGDITLTFEI